MDLNSSYIFACVVQERGFTAAANRLGMPKQTVSRKVAELEKELGSRLLERSTRRLRLTSEGELFFRYAVQIVDLAQKATQSLKGTKEEPQGNLRISASQLFGDLVLRHVLSKYMRLYPKVKVQVLLSQESDHFNDNIDISLELGPLKSSSLIAKRIAPAWLGCYAAPSFLQKCPPLEHPSQLNELPTIEYSEPIPPTQELWKFHQLNTKTIEVCPTPVLRTNSFWVAREATLKGVGIGRLPSSLSIADIKENRLVPLFTEWTCSQGPLYAVFPSRKMMGVQIRVFLEMLEEYLDVSSHEYKRNPLPALVQSTPTLVEPDIWFPEK